MYNDILVPTDGSAGTDQALDHAVDIARTRDATLHALSVVDRRLYISAKDDQQADIKETLEGDAEEAVDTICARAEAEDLDAVAEVRDGIPHAEILDYADDHGIDLVVIGTHGRTGRDKIVNLGSVTERVVGNADRPVLVINIGEDA